MLDVLESGASSDSSSVDVLFGHLAKRRDIADILVPDAASGGDADAEETVLMAGSNVYTYTKTQVRGWEMVCTGQPGIRVPLAANALATGTVASSNARKCHAFQ